LQKAERVVTHEPPRHIRLPHLDRATVWRLARFIVTGGIASGVYAVAALVAVDMFAMSGLVASIVAYLIAIPISFVGQKFWTFRAKGSIASELPRFLVVQAANLAAAAILMAVIVDLLGVDRLIGIAAVVTAIPLATYLLLSRGVFTQRKEE